MSSSDQASLPTQLAAPLPRDPFVGAVIGDRYRVIARIGEGGMGAVYKAEHVLIKKTVALKLLHGELGQVEEAARRFEREAQSASRLSHPHIIAVTDFGRAASGELFLVMEYVPGESLAQAIEDAVRDRGRMPVPRAIALTKQILRALDHAHRQGVVHRDLKPANVMLTPAPDGAGESVKILDFGIAKISAGLTEGEVPLTQGAMVFGTPSYMSPEQATAQDVDARADLYACGVILYELLVGRKPFVAEDIVKVMAMQVTATPPPFAAHAPGARIPASLEAVVMRALEKNKARRFQSAAEFAEALDAAAAAGTVRSVLDRASSTIRPAAAALKVHYARLPWKVRRVVPLGGAALVVLLLVAVPTLFSGGGPKSTPRPPKPAPPALQEPLRRVEEALAKGKLVEARAMLFQQLSKHPKEARVHYLLGNLELAEGKPAAGLDAYEQALERDPGLRGDPVLLLNVKKLFGDKRHARGALELMATQIGRPVADVLVEVASGDPRGEFREIARRGCRAAGCLAKVDLVASHTLDLQQARGCEAKREAIEALAATKDRRALEPLKKARASTRGLAGLFGGANYCVRKEIEAAIKGLEKDLEP